MLFGQNNIIRPENFSHVKLKDLSNKKQTIEEHRKERKPNKWKVNEKRRQMNKTMKKQNKIRRRIEDERNRSAKTK